MRLRSIMLILFCAITLAPFTIFWLWPTSETVNTEIQEVKDRHLIIAQNLADSMERYYLDLTATFEFIADEAERHEDIGHLKGIFRNLEIRHICVANFDSGSVVRSLQDGGPPCPASVPPKRLEWMKTFIDETTSDVILTPVNSSRYGNAMYALLKRGENLYIGAVSTDYLVKLGRQINFGERGHAAIVDQTGQAVSHPDDEWQNDRFNMSRISVVQKMLAGETGVGIFFSPALNESMIAGFTYVKSAGWGVMVPQPIAELEKKADEFKKTALTIMAIGLMLAAAMAYIAAKMLTDPIEQIVQSMKLIGNGELRAYEKIKVNRFQPKEFLGARNGVKAMADKLQENIDTISRHAYLDGVTGLPNRECFRVLAQEEIEKLTMSGNQGAVLFLDLDGFKQVNDIHGHRSGDDLLSGFSKRLHTYCGNVMKRHAKGADNALTILPARLGGDEFVVFLGNIDSDQTTYEFSEGLFHRVFGAYKLHNGVVLQVSGSVGGAIFPGHASDFDELLRLADIAMYNAKNSGKGRYCLHNGKEVEIAKDPDEPQSGESVPA
ncbi:MAG: diguanylate cyclase [Pseudomonadota bacterium]